MVAGVRIDDEFTARGVGCTLFEVARAAGVTIPSSCTQTGECGECIVEVTSGAHGLSPLAEREAHLGPGFRLACCARVVANDPGIQVRTLRRQSIRIETEGTGAGVLGSGISIGTTDGQEGMGLAIDIGTTTVVVRLVDREDGTVLAARAFENPQRFAGSDVISRIAHDAKDAQHHLRSALLAFLAREIRTLSDDCSGIERVVVTGNPTMRDLFFGLDVSPLGQRPFRSVTERDGVKTTLTSSVRALGFDLGLSGDAEVYGLPVIGSHVGADVAGGLLAAGCLDAERPWAYVDIGTNTELVVAAGGRVLAASCPAGPAFEGGRIARGMPAFAGAIERVRLAANGAVELSVVGGSTPIGICGSGLVDCLGALIDAGRLDELGRLDHPKRLDDHGRRSKRGARFVLDAEHDVYLDERDIAEFAQAKGAHAVGLCILTSRLGIRFTDLERVCVAGAFGRHLDPSASMRIGLLPEVPASRIELLGNAAIEGATRVLVSAAAQSEVEQFVRRIEHVELETDPDFFALYAQGCLFRPLQDRPLPDQEVP